MQNHRSRDVENGLFRLKREGVGEALKHSRQEALAIGAARYYGEKCVNGHEGIRYASTNACCMCTRERQNQRNFPKTDSRMLDIDHLKELREMERIANGDDYG